MRYIICYDIKENKIRSRVVKYLESRAFRLQFSVFSCCCSRKEIKVLWRNLLDMLKCAKEPLLMVIPVCKSCEQDVLLHGKPLEEDCAVILV